MLFEAVLFPLVRDMDFIESHIIYMHYISNLIYMKLVKSIYVYIEFCCIF